MSEPIKVGDLVMVARHSGCPSPREQDECMGRIFIVAAILPTCNTKPCSACGGRHGEEFAALDEPVWTAFGMSRLRRIPPLYELEGEQRKEEIKA